MVDIPAYLHLGGHHIVGGEDGVRPSTVPTIFTPPGLAGLATMMIEYQRVVPSDAGGTSGGNYLSYYDGAYTRSYNASAGGASTISIATSIWKVNHYTGKTVTITAGTGAGQSRTVASNTANQLTTSTAWTTVPDATSVFNIGVGGLVQWHYMPASGGGLVPGAFGDCWMSILPTMSPTGMLMQRLGQLHGNTAPGFRMLKVAQAGGIAMWKSGGAGDVALLPRFNDMKGIEEGLGNTIVPRAIIIDSLAEDIWLNNLSVEADLNSALDNIRAVISATALIVVVVPHPETEKTAFPGAGAYLRTLVRAIITTRKLTDPNLAIYEMGWGQFTWRASESITAVGANPRFFDLPTIIQSGIGLYNVIAQHFAPAVSPAGSPLAGVAIISDSQFVSSINPLMAFYANQPSLIGQGPSGTVRPNVWIWDDAVQQLVAADVMAGNLWGTIFAGHGPELTLPRKLLKRFPQGVAILKLAVNGMALGPEAAGATLSFENGSSRFNELRDRTAKFRTSAIQVTGRPVDHIGVLISLGENNTSLEAAITAFEQRSGQLVDDVREVLTSRVTGTLGVVWMQGAPSSAEVTGGSVLGTTAFRNRYRAHLIKLQEDPVLSKPAFRVIRHNGPDDFELQRDSIHLGGEALWKIGDLAAEQILELLDAEDAPGNGAGGGGDDDLGSGGDGAGSGGTDAVEVHTTTEILTILRAAIADGADVAAYTINGRTVQMRGLSELLSALRYFEAVEARTSGVRRTRVRFLA